MADYCRNNILGVRICMQVLKCALPKFPEQLLWTSQSTDKLVTFRISEITKILEYLHCTKTLVLHSRFQKQTKNNKSTFHQECSNIWMPVHLMSLWLTDDFGLLYFKPTDKASSLPHEQRKVHAEKVSCFFFFSVLI